MMIQLNQFQESWEVGRCVEAEANPPFMLLLQWAMGFPTVSQPVGYFQSLAQITSGQTSGSTVPPEGNGYMQIGAKLQ